MVDVLQVGTAVVTRHTDNRLALGRLGALVEQLHALVRSGRQVILVTSGAVCVGRQVRADAADDAHSIEQQLRVHDAVAVTDDAGFLDS